MRFASLFAGVGGQRAARLKALGNAVVPQVAELVGRAINEMEGECNGEV